MNNLITSWIRTLVPVAVAWLIVRLEPLGVALDPTAIEGLALPLITAVWYTAARALENLNPLFGWLLGSPKAPSYETE